ncbi:MAG: hypothetical protein ABF759_12635 [Acetobacter malorum]|uniref:hypothetical protein n=1 Tax=Acetobacter malorum TaxID=178901 RepID=UPI0039ED062E
MLAYSGRSVRMLQIGAGITDLFDNPGEIDLSITIRVVSDSAEEVSCGRDTRTRADTHIEATVEKELLDFRA